MAAINGVGGLGAAQTAPANAQGANGGDSAAVMQQMSAQYQQSLQQQNEMQMLTQKFQSEQTGQTLKNESIGGLIKHTLETCSEAIKNAANTH